MGSVPPLLTFLLMTVSGWVHRRQLMVIEFLKAENRMLKERLRGKRIRFTDAERALLARKAKAVGRKDLLELDSIVSPDTLMRWHRRLVAQKSDYSARRGVGRPGIMREISDLIVRMATENPGWGYTRIQGALANLNHKVGRGTVANVLKRNGIEPAPERSTHTKWSTFLKCTHDSGSATTPRCRVSSSPFMPKSCCVSDSKLRQWRRLYAGSEHAHDEVDVSKSLLKGPGGNRFLHSSHRGRRGRQCARRNALPDPR
jgi:hypothetical protein